ncbi:hypothetical protein V8D89_007991, partial [Ganoderma adspersum]
DEELGFIGETSFHEGWKECGDVLRERDQDNVTAMSEELDAFLEFSGIFSAVITLFVSQSATSLQPDTSQLTVDVLRTISQQLADQHTPAIAALPPFQSAPFDIVLNSLLNAGLLCSLIASGMSLWVKQWLREYVLDEPALPRARARVRLFRYHGLRAWRMRALVACISILLQLSVLLFSTGVVMLAYKMNATLAWVLLGLNAGWWAVTWGSALCPTFAAASPFKSPLSRAIFRAAYQARRVLCKRFALTGETECSVGVFRTLEKRELHETSRQQAKPKLELEALAFANRELWGSKRLTAINECFREVDDKAKALRRIEKILRAHYGMKTESDTFESRGEQGLQTQDEVVKQLMRIWCDVFAQLEEVGEEKEKLQKRCLIFDAVSRGVGGWDPSIMTAREGA